MNRPTIYVLMALAAYFLFKGLSGGGYGGEHTSSGYSNRSEVARWNW